jgi:uncharacterized membrane protein
MTRPNLLHRVFRHLCTDRATVRRMFPKDSLKRIESLIAAGEREHRGQLRFAVEAALPLTRLLHGARPRARALEVFGSLGIWDTAETGGVLFSLLLADRDGVMFADRGILALVGTAAWEAICHKMETAFRAGRFGEGVETGLAEINALLVRHYPREGRPVGNELSDRPVLL